MIKNCIFNYFINIIILISADGMADTQILKIIFLTKFKNSASFQVISFDSIQEESFTEVIKIIEDQIM